MKRNSDTLDVYVDWGLCIGCQICVSMAGKTFEMTKNVEGEDKAQVKEGFGDTEGAIEEAKQCCPVAAIIVKKMAEQNAKQQE